MADLSRREFALSSVAALGLATLPSVAAPARVLDLHTHVFSVLYLPIEAINARWCKQHDIPEVIGRAIARIFNTIAVLMNDIVVPREELERFVDYLLRVTEEELVQEFFLLAPPEVFVDRIVRNALHAVDDITLEGVLPKERFRKAIGKLFERFKPAIPRYFQTAVAYFRWVRLLLHHERDIAATLRHVSPGVGYFVHHLMDMDEFYDGTSFYDVLLHQIPRMRRLASPTMFGFVAYNPQKSNGLDIVHSALTNGFAGVKFYPPNGYRPLGNPGPFGKIIDARNRTFFYYCEKEEVPVFTHCTPEGFESVPGMGCYADPRHWRVVLQEFPDLRLCFAHAGGEEWWLDLPPNDCKEPGLGQAPPFGKEVVGLATTAKHVYCEIAYFNHLNDPTQQQKFATHLRTAASKKQFEQRVCYGTDWMMPQMFIDGPKAYLQQLRSIFTDPELAPWQERFFFRNAISFLHLPGFIKRHEHHNPGFLSPKLVSALEDLANAS